MQRHSQFEYFTFLTPETETFKRLIDGLKYSRYKKTFFFLSQLNSYLAVAAMLIWGYFSIANSHSYTHPSTDFWMAIGMTFSLVSLIGIVTFIPSLFLPFLGFGFIARLSLITLQLFFAMFKYVISWFLVKDSPYNKLDQKFYHIFDDNFGFYVRFFLISYIFDSLLFHQCFLNKQIEFEAEEKYEEDKSSTVDSEAFFM